MVRNIFFIILLLFVTFNLFGQNKLHSIYIKGIITTDGIAISDVKINIIVNEIKEKTINNGNNGEYNFTLEPAKDYIIEYTKQDFVTKLISISTKEVTQDEIKYGMFPLSIDIQLFEDFEGLNAEVLKQPVEKWSFSDYEGDFINDIPYSLLMKEKADNVKSQMLKLKKQAYDKLIVSADNNFKNKELENAWLDYNNSLKILPKEIYPKNQITEIKRLINEKMSIDEAYNRSIERADKHFSKKNYKNALGFYKKSLLYKPNEKYPQTQISEIEKILNVNNEYIVKVEITDQSDELFALKKNNDSLNINKKDTDISPTQHNTNNKNIVQHVIPNNNNNTAKNKSSNIISNKSPDTLVTINNTNNINKLNESVTNLIKSGNKEELAKTYYNLAIQYYNSTDFDKAIDYYNFTFKTNEQLGLKKINASLAEEIATVYENIFRYSKAIEFYNKSYLLYKELGDNKNAASVMQKIGDVNYISGNYVKAIDYYKKSVHLENEVGTKTDISNKLNSIGISYFQAGNYDEAIKYFQQSIKSAEEIGNNVEKSMSLNNIGNVKYEYNNFDDAINYYSQSITLKKQIDYKKGIAVTLHNIGNVYKKLKQFAQSLQYFKQSFEIADETNNKELKCENYFSFSEVYATLKDCNKALENYKLYASNKNIITRDLSHDQLVEASFSTNESDESNKKFVLLKTEMQRQQMLARYESEKNSKEIAFMSQQAKIHSLKLIKKEQKLKNQQILIAFSLISLIIVMFLASMFYRQYKDKKQAFVKLEEQNEEINIQKEEIESQRDLVIVQKEKLETIHSELTSSIRYAQRIQTAVLPTKEQLNLLFENNFVFYKPRDIVSGDFYWATKIKAHPLTPSQREGENGYGYYTADPLLYKLLKERAEEMRKNPTEAESVLWKYLKTNQTDYHFRRQHIVDRFIVDFVCLKKMMVIEVDGDIHDYQLEEDNLRTSMLNDKGFKVIRFKNEEILAKPEEVISKIKKVLEEHEVLPFGEDLGGAELLIVAVADCTGHGVPGAFMSILGISLLDEIVRKEQITTPNIILNKLRENIISSLQQKNIADNKQLSDNVYDGMDIAICVINYEKMELQFAGANSPLYIVKSEKLKVKSEKDTQNNDNANFVNFTNFELYELKGDKMPVGMYTVMEPFTNHIVKINKDDLIYLFSDGFADQFGGPKGRKFLHSQLKNILLKNASLNINEQKEILEKTYNNWRGSLSQVDDILILGIKV